MAVTKCVLLLSFKRSYNPLVIGGKLAEKGVHGRKRVYGFIAVTIVVNIGLSVFLSLESNAQLQASTSSNPTSAISTPSNVTPTLASTPNPTPTPTPVHIPVPVDFTCDVGSPYAFTVTCAVDLNDGMNSNEAIAVAEAIFNHEMTNATFEVKSANVSDAGIWTGYLLWGAVSPDGHHESHSHFFNVVVNPLNKTVTYSRCY
jgi:hypothetical protein